MEIEALKGLPPRLKLVAYEVLTDALEGDVATLRERLEKVRREHEDSESVLRTDRDLAQERARMAEAQLKEAQRAFDTLVNAAFTK
jgi:hypothetical protein